MKDLHRPSIEKYSHTQLIENGKWTVNQYKEKQMITVKQLKNFQFFEIQIYIYRVIFHLIYIHLSCLWNAANTCIPGARNFCGYDSSCSGTIAY